MQFVSVMSDNAHNPEGLLIQTGGFVLVILPQSIFKSNAQCCFFVREQHWVLVMERSNGVAVYHPYYTASFSRSMMEQWRLNVAKHYVA